MQHLGRSWIVVVMFALCLLFSVTPLVPAPAEQEPQQDADPQDTGKWPYATHGSIGLTANFVNIDGSENKYRTDYNEMTGFALDHFTLDLKHETSRWMDFLSLNGTGFGGAYPHEQATLRFGKEGAYEFHGRYWKQVNFFNLPEFDLGSRSQDSARRTTDLNLSLFPHSNVTVELSYYRNYSYGTAYSSVTSYTNIVEMLNPKRGLTQDFRVGARVDRGPLNFSVFQNFRRFKEDPEQSENRLIGEGTLPEIDISAPIRQSVPSTHLVGRYAPSDRWMVEGKYTYSDGHIETDYSQSEVLQFTPTLGFEEIVRATTIGDRPEHLAEGTFTLALSDRWVFSNLAEYHSFDVTGSMLKETTLQGLAPGSGSITVPEEADRALEYTLFQDRPQLEFFLHPDLSFYAGYRYTGRKVEETLDPTHGPEENTTHTNSGLAGASWKPYRGARLSLEFEKGTTDNAYTNTEPRSVTNWRVSSRFPISRHLSISPHFLIANQTNNTADNTFDSDQRQAGLELIYTIPDSDIIVSGGYSLFYIDSIADIRYFLSGAPVEDASRYKTQLHFFHSFATVPVTPKFTLRMGYNLLRDPDGNSYPLKRHMGQAGLVYHVAYNWTVDLGWRYLSYSEDALDLQDYSANQVAITLGWSF